MSNQVDNTLEAKVQVEQVRLRQRNSFEVINQIVTEYNSSNGWSLVKVIPTPLNIEVFLERSSKQAGKGVEVETKAEVKKAEVVTEPEAKESKTTSRVKATEKKPTKRV